MCGDDVSLLCVARFSGKMADRARAQMAEREEGERLLQSGRLNVHSAEAQSAAASDAAAQYGDDTDPRSARDETELRERVANWNAAQQKAEAKGPFAGMSDAAITAKQEAASARANAEEYATLMEKVRKMPDEMKREFLEEFSDGGDKDEMVKRLHAFEVREAQLTESQRELLTADGEAPTLLIGARVELVGLKGRPELNGSRGVCEAFVKAKMRCAIRVDGAAEADAPLALKPCNVRRWSER